MDEQEQGFSRRDLLALACCIPFIGGVMHLVGRAGRRYDRAREATQIPARSIIDPARERQLPIGIAAQAAAEKEEEGR